MRANCLFSGFFNELNGIGRQATRLCTPRGIVRVHNKVRASQDFGKISPVKRAKYRFRGAIFRSMAAGWAPNEEPAALDSHASIDSLRGLVLVRPSSHEEEPTMTTERSERTARLLLMQ